MARMMTAVIPRLLMMALLAAGLAACAGSNDGPPPGSPASLPDAPAPARAQVVVYRLRTVDHFLRSPAIDVNGVPVCDLPNGEVFAQDVAPGSVTVSSSLWDWPGTSRVTFQAEAGKRYFVRMSPNGNKRLAGLLGGHPGVWLAEAVTDRPGPFLLDVIREDEAVASLKGISMAACKAHP